MQRAAIFVLTVMVWAFLLGPLAADAGSLTAQVTVKLHAQVTPQQVEAALGIPIGEISEVHYDWGFYLIGSGGGLSPLIQSDNARLRYLEGPLLNTQAVFQAPPGQHLYQLMVEAYVLQTRTYDDTIAVTVARWSPLITLKGSAGQKLTIIRSLGPHD